jgi:hypothetical protein
MCMYIFVIYFGKISKHFGNMYFVYVFRNSAVRCTLYLQFTVVIAGGLNADIHSTKDARWYIFNQKSQFG